MVNSKNKIIDYYLASCYYYFISLRLILIFHAKVFCNVNFSFTGPVEAKPMSLFNQLFIFSQNTFSSQVSGKLSFIEGMSSKFAISISSDQFDTVSFINIYLNRITVVEGNIKCLFQIISWEDKLVFQGHQGNRNNNKIMENDHTYHKLSPSSIFCIHQMYFVGGITVIYVALITC